MAKEFYDRIEGHDTSKSKLFFENPLVSKEKKEKARNYIDFANKIIIGPLRNQGFKFAVTSTAYQSGKETALRFFKLSPEVQTEEEAEKLARAIAAFTDSVEKVAKVKSASGSGKTDVAFILKAEPEWTNPEFAGSKDRGISSVDEEGNETESTGPEEQKQEGNEAPAESDQDIDPAESDPVTDAGRASNHIITDSDVGSQDETAAGQSFASAAQSGISFGDVINVIRSIITTTTNTTISKVQMNRNFDLVVSDALISEIAKVAYKISQISNIRYEDAEDFLYILITIDSPEVMVKFAEATGISELADPNLIGKPFEILAIPNIQNLAFLADAIMAIIRAYRNFSTYENYETKTEGNDTPDILKAIDTGLGLLSSLSGGGSTGPTAHGGPGVIMGPLMSLLLKGKEVPMTVQANNPTAQARTFFNLAYFGAQKISTQLFDNDQVFNQAMAVFKNPINGAGSGAFMGKNAGSMNKANMNLGDVIGGLFNKAFSGAMAPKKEKKEKKFKTTIDPNEKGTVNRMLKDTSQEKGDLDEQIGTQEQQDRTLKNDIGDMADKILDGVKEMASGALGAKLTEAVDGLSKADNAIPILSSFSNALGVLPDMIPQINSEFRRNFENITSKPEEIKKLFGSMVNLENALKLGLNALTTNVPTGVFGSMLQMPNFFPTSTFKQGWQNMSSVNQAMHKDKFYQQVIFILNNLG